MFGLLFLHHYVQNLLSKYFNDILQIWSWWKSAPIWLIEQATCDAMEGIFAQISLANGSRIYLKGIGILLPKLFWPTVRKNCSSDREKLLKFEGESQEFSNIY